LNWGVHWRNFPTKSEEIVLKDLDSLMSITIGIPFLLLQKVDELYVIEYNEVVIIGGIKL